MTRLATTPAILGILVGGMLAAGLAAGCSSNQVAIGSQNLDAQAPGADAAASRGGAVAGGSSGSATGGAVGVGGATPSGGTTGSGAGGSKASGGTIASGGSKAGGTIATGGATGTGGSGSGGATATCALVGESCATNSCCGPLICRNFTGSSTCFESIPPPADSGTGQGGTGGAGGGTGGTGGAPKTGGAGGNTGTGGAGGSTGKTCGGLAGASCATNEFCDLLAGSCNVSDATGTCVVKKKTGDCPVFTVAPPPVCGCDGQTYYDDCERQVAGVYKKSDGACPTSDAGATTCGQVTNRAGCDSRSDCHSVFMDTASCGCSVVGCCLNFVRCAEGGRAKCTPPAGFACTIAQPVCGGAGNYVNSYTSNCYEGCVLSSECAAAADASVIMTPTLPAACQNDRDCCVAMDTCTAMAYLVGRTEYTAMVASIPSAASQGMCVSCIQPAVQVQCQGGFCAGEKLPFSPGATSLMSSHCGYISVSDAGTSAHAAVDAGTAAGPSTWSCSSH